MKVRVKVSFNGMRKGDVGLVSPDGLELAQRYVEAGHLGVIDGGDGTDRSRGPAKGDQGGVPYGAGAYGQAGGEQG